MRQKPLNETKKKIALISVILFLVVVGTIVSAMIINNQKEKAALLQIEGKFNEVQNEINENSQSFELMYNYISKNLPYYTSIMEKDMVSQTVSDMIKNTWHTEEHAADHTSEDSVQQLDYLMWDLQSALLNRSAEDLMALFDINAYVSYVNSFESFAALEEDLNNIMNTLTKEGTFEKLSYKKYKSEKSNQLEITLYYSDKITHKWLLETRLMEHHHADIGNEKGKIEVFSTKFEKLLKDFK